MSTELTTLATLAIEINALDDQANYHAGQAVVYAAKCGQKLLQAKAECKHGEFGNWLIENCRVKRTQANSYMKLATDMPSLLSSNYQSAGNLPSVQQAIALLSAPEEVKAEVTERIENGENVTVKEIQELKRKAKEAEEKAQATLIELNQEKELNDALREQRDRMLADKDGQIKRLQDAQNKIVEAKTAEAKALALLDAQEEINQAKAEADKLKQQLNKLNKEQANAVKHEVERELLKRQQEINALESHIHLLNQEENSLKQTIKSLDAEVGLLQTHREYIKEIRLQLAQCAAEVQLCQEQGEIPNEVLNDWRDIINAMQILHKDTLEWFEDQTILEAVCINAA